MREGMSPGASAVIAAVPLALVVAVMDPGAARGPLRAEFLLVAADGAIARFVRLETGVAALAAARLATERLPRRRFVRLGLLGREQRAGVLQGLFGRDALAGGLARGAPGRGRLVRGALRSPGRPGRGRGLPGRGRGLPGRGLLRRGAAAARALHRGRLLRGGLARAGLLRAGLARAGALRAGLRDGG